LGIGGGPFGFADGAYLERKNRHSVWKRWLYFRRSQASHRRSIFENFDFLIWKAWLVRRHVRLFGVSDGFEELAAAGLPAVTIEPEPPPLRRPL
jgi:hypothetical protein